MIARTVNQHKPITVLENKYFDKYIVSKKNINKKNIILNIDELPVYI